MAFIGRNTVEIGLNLDPDGFAEFFARCSMLHITKLEDLPEPWRDDGSLVRVFRSEYEGFFGLSGNQGV